LLWNFLWFEVRCICLFVDIDGIIDHCCLLFSIANSDSLSRAFINHVFVKFICKMYMFMMSYLVDSM
jgi:hypothetical protein